MEPSRPNSSNSQANPAPGVPVIQVEELSKTYPMGSSQVQALRQVSFSIRRGEFVALMGASGSGKSTLLQLLGCLDRPTAGAYYLEGKDVSRLSNDERARIRNQRIGFVFQNFNLLPRLSALENVSLPLLYGARSKDARGQAARALERVGLANRAHHLPVKLSGGERQRVAIARALVIDPAIILADEPTGSLDSVTGGEVMRLLSELWQDGRTLLLVTHDARIASYARYTLYLEDGQLSTAGAPESALVFGQTQGGAHVAG